ncbi:cohesin subunit scc-3-like [Homalodisca vitripennis]|uniref:cohesin subunit scc-3-like n=1 Tax=Homalodisca vitripennis TaxID=197043 RepID=UPI001EEBBAC7|nr:cohesin subunit scc-3-like [Homalodisca vitripennis]
MHFSTRLVELKRKMGLVTGESLKRIQRQHKTIDEYIRENSNIILHSFRDVELLVRKCAFHMFKLLLHYFPSVFVHDFYLRATFWQLFDSTPTMRILAIQFYSSMLANSRFNTRLDVYSRKCIPELCKLTRDENPKVTVEAIKALKLITRYFVSIRSICNIACLFSDTLRNL